MSSTVCRLLGASDAHAARIVRSLALGIAGLLLLPAVSSAQPAVVPSQYIAKIYTEGLGRGPTESEWAAATKYFQREPRPRGSRGCTPASVKALGKSVLTSPEFADLEYSHAALPLVAYRAVLNREPDTAGYTRALSALDDGESWSALLDRLYATPEFARLASDSICDPSSPDYDFGTAPVIDIPTEGPGYTGSEAGLQALLDATPPGGTVTLARRAVIHLTSTLRVPAGVTLTTAGSVPVTKYAEMARLVREPGFSGQESIGVQPGGTLRNVWVGGQRMRQPAPYDRLAFNMRTYGGAGTSVRDTRLDDTAGATNLETHGADIGRPCTDNVFSGNLITVYTSEHDPLGREGLWSDGISNLCEDASITRNTVIDATDVGIILFGTSSTVAQHSEVAHNTVIQAGEGTFAMFGADPYFNPNGDGDKPGQASHLFTGANVHDNTMWSSRRTASHFGMTVGTKAWFGRRAYNGTGARFADNTTGSLSITADSGIDVAGMLDATVTGNTLTVHDEDVSPCPDNVVGASVSAGYASGTIQPYTDALYDGCLIPGGVG